jgi:hypothetical protein
VPIAADDKLELANVPKATGSLHRRRHWLQMQHRKESPLKRTQVPAANEQRCATVSFTPRFGNKAALVPFTCREC